MPSGKGQLPGTVDPAAGTTYTATVGTGARDTAGNALAAPTTWSFGTAAAGSTASPGAVVVRSGSIVGGSHADLAADDDRFLQVQSTSARTYTARLARTLRGHPE